VGGWIIASEKQPELKMAFQTKAVLPIGNISLEENVEANSLHLTLLSVHTPPVYQRKLDGTRLYVQHPKEIHLRREIIEHRNLGLMAIL
jgi:hypothetical protein